MSWCDSLRMMCVGCNQKTYFICQPDKDAVSREGSKNTGLEKSTISTAYTKARPEAVARGVRPRRAKPRGKRLCGNTTNGSRPLQEQTKISY